MHVAFFTQGTTVPAARFRVEQLVAALARHVTCTVLPAKPSVYGDAPGVGRWRAVAKPLSIASRIGQLSALRDADVAWMQRPLTEYYTTLLERIVTRRLPSVFDFDDAIFHNRWGLEARKIRAIIDRVAHVVVGNAYLAEFVGKPEKTSIIPTVVDETRYTPRADPDGPFTLVWTGMSHNLRELAPYTEAIARVLGETRGRLVVIADRLDPTHLRTPLGSLEAEFVPWSPETEVAALSAGHVGLMPLADTRYNRGKCAFKLIQYMARAIPVVASPVGANCEVVRHGIDGFHASSTTDWEDALLALARDRDLRVRMGREGRARVEATYSVSAAVPQILDVLKAVA
jgi:glycosyltransferase involved in cell wall biosynthesis